jgi:hypothetical protein
MLSPFANALHADFCLPPLNPLVPARYAQRSAPLSMLPAMRLTAADPARLSRAYCTVQGDDAKPEPAPNGSRKIIGFTALPG